MTGLFQPRTGSDSCPSLKVTEEELGQVVDTGLGGTCHTSGSDQQENQLVTVRLDRCARPAGMQTPSEELVFPPGLWDQPCSFPNSVCILFSVLPCISVL